MLSWEPNLPAERLGLALEPLNSQSSPVDSRRQAPSAASVAPPPGMIEEVTRTTSGGAVHWYRKSPQQVGSLTVHCQNVLMRGLIAPERLWPVCVCARVWCRSCPAIRWSQEEKPGEMEVGYQGPTRRRP